MVMFSRRSGTSFWHLRISTLMSFAGNRRNWACPVRSLRFSSPRTIRPLACRALSEDLIGDVDRLGQINPGAEPYRAELETAGVTVIDLTALESGDPLNHGKFAESPEVVRLLGERLMAGQTISGTQPAFATDWKPWRRGEPRKP